MMTSISWAVNGSLGRVDEYEAPQSPCNIAEAEATTLEVLERILDYARLLAAQDNGHAACSSNQVGNRRPGSAPIWSAIISLESLRDLDGRYQNEDNHNANA